MLWLILSGAITATLLLLLCLLSLLTVRKAVESQKEVSLEQIHLLEKMLPLLVATSLSEFQTISSVISNSNEEDPGVDPEELDDYLDSLERNREIGIELSEEELDAITARAVGGYGPPTY